MSSRLMAVLTGLLAVPCGLLAQGKPVEILLPTTHPSASQAPAGPATGALGASALYVSGKVAVSDGGELPPNVVITKVCGNKQQALGFADNKGNFSVKIAGSSLAALVDASDDNRGAIGRMPSAMRDQGGANLLGCEILASFPGYRSESVNISSRRSLDNPDIGTILIHRLGGSAGGTMISETMLQAPKKALKAYHHALDDLRKSDTESARKNLEKALAIDPRMAGAWYELGHLQLNSDPANAKVNLQKALAADPKYALPYTDLTVLAFRQENWADTIRMSELGLHLDSTSSSELYFLNAATQFRLGHLEEAEKKARDAIKIDYGHNLPKGPELLGYILEARHDYPGAAEQLRAYLADDPADSRMARRELARIESALQNGRMK